MLTVQSTPAEERNGNDLIERTLARIKLNSKYVIYARNDRLEFL